MLLLRQSKCKVHATTTLSRNSLRRQIVHTGLLLPGSTRSPYSLLYHGAQHGMKRCVMTTAEFSEEESSAWEDPPLSEGENSTRRGSSAKNLDETMERELYIDEFMGRVNQCRNAREILEITDDMADEWFTPPVLVELFQKISTFVKEADEQKRRLGMSDLLHERSSPLTELMDSSKTKQNIFGSKELQMETRYEELCHRLLNKLNDGSTSLTANETLALFHNVRQARDEAHVDLLDAVVPLMLHSDFRQTIEAWPTRRLATAVSVVTRAPDSPFPAINEILSIWTKKMKALDKPVPPAHIAQVLAAIEHRTANDNILNECLTSLKRRKSTQDSVFGEKTELKLLLDRQLASKSNTSQFKDIDEVVAMVGSVQDAVSSSFESTSKSIEDWKQVSSERLCHSLRAITIANSSSVLPAMLKAIQVDKIGSFHSGRVLNLTHALLSIVDSNVDISPQELDHLVGIFPHILSRTDSLLLENEELLESAISQGTSSMNAASMSPIPSSNIASLFTTASWLLERLSQLASVNCSREEEMLSRVQKYREALISFTETTFAKSFSVVFMDLSPSDITAVCTGLNQLHVFPSAIMNLVHKRLDSISEHLQYDETISMLQAFWSAGYGSVSLPEDSDVYDESPFHTLGLALVHCSSTHKAINGIEALASSGVLDATLYDTLSDKLWPQLASVDLKYLPRLLDSILKLIENGVEIYDTPNTLLLSTSVADSLVPYSQSWYKISRRNRPSSSVDGETNPLDEFSLNTLSKLFEQTALLGTPHRPFFSEIMKTIALSSEQQSLISVQKMLERSIVAASNVFAFTLEECTVEREKHTRTGISKDLANVVEGAILLCDKYSNVLLRSPRRPQEQYDDIVTSHLFFMSTLGVLKENNFSSEEKIRKLGEKVFSSLCLIPLRVEDHTSEDMISAVTGIESVLQNLLSDAPFAVSRSMILSFEDFSHWFLGSLAGVDEEQRQCDGILSVIGSCSSLIEHVSDSGMDFDDFQLEVSNLFPILERALSLMCFSEDGNVRNYNWIPASLLYFVNCIRLVTDSPQYSETLAHSVMHLNNIIATSGADMIKTFDGRESLDTLYAIRTAIEASKTLGSGLEQQTLNALDTLSRSLLSDSGKLEASEIFKVIGLHAEIHRNVETSSMTIGVGQEWCKLLPSRLQTSELSCLEYASLIEDVRTITGDTSERPGIVGVLENVVDFAKYQLADRISARFYDHLVGEVDTWLEMFNKKDDRFCLKVRASNPLLRSILSEIHAKTISNQYILSSLSIEKCWSLLECSLVTLAHNQANDKEAEDLIQSLCKHIEACLDTPTHRNSGYEDVLLGDYYADPEGSADEVKTFLLEFGGHLPQSSISSLLSLLESCCGAISENFEMNGAFSANTLTETLLILYNIGATQWEGVLDPDDANEVISAVCKSIQVASRTVYNISLDVLASPTFPNINADDLFWKPHNTSEVPELMESTRQLFIRGQNCSEVNNLLPALLTLPQQCASSHIGSRLLKTGDLISLYITLNNWIPEMEETVSARGNSALQPYLNHAKILRDAASIQAFRKALRSVKHDIDSRGRQSASTERNILSEVSPIEYSLIASSLPDLLQRLIEEPMQISNEQSKPFAELLGHDHRRIIERATRYMNPTAVATFLKGATLLPWKYVASKEYLSMLSSGVDVLSRHLKEDNPYGYRIKDLSADGALAIAEACEAMTRVATVESARTTDIEEIAEALVSATKISKLFLYVEQNENFNTKRSRHPLRLLRISLRLCRLHARLLNYFYQQATDAQLSELSDKHIFTQLHNTLQDVEAVKRDSLRAIERLRQSSSSVVQKRVDNEVIQAAQDAPKELEHWRLDTHLANKVAQFEVTAHRDIVL